MIKRNDVSVDDIQNVVKIIKSKAFLNLSCQAGKLEEGEETGSTLLSNKHKLSQVLAVEQNLGIESSEQIMETLTKKELQTAAKMFLYLISCPDPSFKFWSSFYNDLFLTQPTDQIILTLNRMMKPKGTRVEDGNIRARKLMIKISNKLSLGYKEIQRLARREQVEQKTEIINSGSI